MRPPMPHRSSHRLGQLLAIGLGAFATLTPPVAFAAGVDGRVEVAETAYKPVFLDKQLFFPGTKVTFAIDPRIDAMRWMYEERHCWSKWFGGIHCKWVSTSRASGLHATQTPLALRFTLNGSRTPVGVVSPAMAPTAFDPEPHLIETERTFTLPLTSNEMLQGAFTKGYQLEGRLAPYYGANAAPIERGPCRPHQNNRYCTQGQFVVTVAEVDVSVRVEQLAQYLTTRRSYAEISSPATIDFYLLNNVRSGAVAPATERKKAIALLLLEHTRNHYVGADSANADRGRILELASGFFPENTEIRNEMVSFHIASGDLSAARTSVTTLLGDLDRKYRDGTISNAELRDYATALRNSGAIHLADNVAVKLDDVQLAAGAYSRSIDLWEEYATKANVDRRTIAPEIAKAYVDQARVLSLLKTPATLLRAADALRHARSLVPRSRPGMVVAVTREADRLLTFDVPANFGGTSALVVSLQFLPPGYDSLVQSLPALGVRLVRTDSGQGRRYARLNADGSENLARSEASDLADPRLSGDNLVGLAADGRLVRVSDTTAALSTARPAAWSTATAADLVAWVEASQPGLVRLRAADAEAQIDLGAEPVRALAIAPDGRRLAVLHDRGDDQAISLYALDPAQPATPSLTASIALTAKADGVEAPVFTSDGGYVLARRASVLAMINAQGEARHIALKSSAVLPVRDALIVSTSVQKDTVRELTLVDVATTFAAAKPLSDAADKPSGLQSVRLAAPLPAEDFAIVSYSCGSAAACRIELHARTLAGLLRTYTANGDGRGSRPAPHALVVNTLQPLSGGTLVAHEDPIEGWAEIISLTSTAAETRYAASPGGRIKVVALGGAGDEARFHLVTLSAVGQVDQIRTFGAAGALVSTAVLPAGQWRLLAEPSGPLSRQQEDLRLIEIVPPPSTASPAATSPELAYKALTPTAVRVLSIDRSGGVTARTLPMRAPQRVVTLVGTAPVERTDEGLVWSDADGNLTPMSKGSCVGGFCPAAPFYRSHDAGVVVAQTRQPAPGQPLRLELKRWTNANDVVDYRWDCPACAISEPATIANVGGLRAAPFAIAPTSDILMLPFARELVAGPAAQATWDERISAGRPVAVSDQTLVVQKDAASFEVWSLRK